MKKRVVLSISLIVVGLVFECLHFLTDIRFFAIKFSILGIICLVTGVLGILWFSIIPVLERRAEVLGKFKKGRFKNNH